MECVETWSEAELEQAIAWLGRCCLKSARAIEPTHTQGRLAEYLVTNRLADAERVNHRLSLWRRAMLPHGPAARQKGAASNPDWLVLDEVGNVTAIVEVKAVRGDARTISEDRRAYRESWESIPEVVTAPLESWQHRIQRAWCGHGPRFANQLGKHLDRLAELEAAGVLSVAPDCRAILYVPEGERYFELPATVRLRDLETRPLEIRLLPSLERLIGLIKCAFSQAFPGEELPNERLFTPRHSSADEVRRRMSGMQQLLPRFQKLLATVHMHETDARLARLILGTQPVYHDRHPEWSLDWHEREPLLERVHSVAPSLTAQVLFDTAAGRNGSGSRREREALIQWAGMRQAGLNELELGALLGCLTRLRLRLRNREWPLPPLEETIAQVSGETASSE